MTVLGIRANLRPCSTSSWALVRAFLAACRSRAGLVAENIAQSAAARRDEARPTAPTTPAVRSG